MKLLTILLLACAIFSCKEQDIKQLALPEGVDGFKERDKANVMFFADKYLTIPSSQKPELPHVGSSAIIRYYELDKTKTRAVEAFLNGVTYYMKEADIFFNYASCSSFNNKLLNDLASLNGLVLSGKLSNQFYQKNRSYMAKLLRQPLRNRDILSYDSFSIKFGSSLYYIQFIEKQIAYCEGAHPITQVIDFIAHPDHEQETQEFISLCLQLDSPENSIFGFKSNGTDESSGFFNVIDAWQFDIEKLKWVHVTSNLPKCYNECAKGCD